MTSRQRGGTPGREPVYGVHAILGICIPARQRKHRVVEPEECHLIVRRHGAQEVLDGALQPRHHRPHAAADVDGDGQLQGNVLGREIAEGLRLAILVHAERRLWNPRDELAFVIRHRHCDRDGVDLDFVGVPAGLSS